MFFDMTLYAKESVFLSQLTSLSRQNVIIIHKQIEILSLYNLEILSVHFIYVCDTVMNAIVLIQACKF